MRTVILLIVIGFLTSCASRQPEPAIRRAEPRISAGSPYQQLVRTLSESSQSNVAAQVSQVISSLQAERNAAEIYRSIVILEDLRAGRTNEAFQLLETQLDNTLTELSLTPANAWNSNFNNVSIRAERYRKRYPYNSIGGYRATAQSDKEKAHFIQLHKVIHLDASTGAKAVLQFTNATSNTFSYRWSYRSSQSSEVKSGAGTVRECYERMPQQDGTYALTPTANHNTTIRMEDISLEWSSSGSGGDGWLYYNSDQLTIKEPLIAPFDL